MTPTWVFSCTATQIRLYPLVPLPAGQVLRDDTIRGRSVPAGSLVVVDQFHRSLDSPLEEARFEPSVPREVGQGSRLLIGPVTSHSAKGTHPFAAGDRGSNQLPSPGNHSLPFTRVAKARNSSTSLLNGPVVSSPIPGIARRLSDTDQAIVSTTPPSTGSAVSIVAEAWGDTA